MFTYTIADLLSYLAQFYPNQRLLITPFGYPLSISNLAAAGVSSNQISIAANADFVMTGLFHHATADDQTVSSKLEPLVRVLITDSGSNEQFTNAAVDLANYSTNDSKLNPLAFPRMISGRTSLTVTLTNYSAADEYDLELFISGVLVRAYNN